MLVAMTEQDIEEYRAKVAELSTNLQLSRLQLEQRQLDKFRSLAAYAYKRSPYYREIIARDGIDLASCRPDDFPVLTKTDVLENFDRIVTDPTIKRSRVEEFLRRSHDPFELFDGRYMVFSSSGTSGQPGITLFSIKEYLEGTAQTTRLVPKVPEQLPRKIRVAFVGAIGGHFAGVSMFAGFRTGPNRSRYETLLVDIYKPWREIAHALNEFQPDAVLAYTGALRELAHRQERGELAIAPRALTGGAELMTPADRIVIERVFKVPLTNMYASSECLYMAGGKTADDMMLFEDDLIFDRREDHTRITNLFNYTMPLIQYRMNDILVTQTEKTANDPFTRIKDIVGRRESDLMLENSDGDTDWVSAIALAVMHVPNVKRFQFVVQSRTYFTCKVCFDADIDESAKRSAFDVVSHELRVILGKKKMTNVGFDIEQVAEIPVDQRTGKVRFVVQV